MSENQFFIRQLLGRTVRFGGQQHSGWLPPEASMPVPTPIEEAILDFHIVVDDQGHGYFLEWVSRNTVHCGDTWRESLEGALEQAQHDFGIDPQEWTIADGLNID